MKKPSQMESFDALYAIAARDGRGEALFGNSIELARPVYERTLIGNGYPIAHLEFPLLGNPCFDMLSVHSHVAPGARFVPGAGFGYQGMFDWFAGILEAGERAGCGIELDISAGETERAGVYLQQRSCHHLVAPFLESVGETGRTQSYLDMLARMPEGWHVWYAGVHPGRPGSPVRVDCFVDAGLKDAYATDVSLLENDLAACGFEATGPALPSLARPPLDSPFGLELQFDVMPDGSLGPTLGISAAFSLRTAHAMRPLFEEGGPAAELLGAVERLELADDRWRRIPDAMISKLVPADGTVLALYCVPTFVKLRMRDGRPLDAKAYLQAGTSTLG